VQDGNVHFPLAQDAYERVDEVGVELGVAPVHQVGEHLHRLEKRGWLKAEWGLSEANQRAKYYRLTAAGKAQLRREQDRWSRLVHAIGRIMNPAPAD
jgi:predicted ArsR family transcriptional regulator